MWPRGTAIDHDASWSMDSEWTPLGDVVDRSAGRRYYSSFRKGGSTFSVGQTVLLKADEATMKWCRNSKPPRCAWMLASGGTPATISDMWDGGSDDGAEEERSPACGRFTWYNFPDECSGARGFQNVFNEVYATEMTMEYELDTINGHVAVYKSPEACTAQTGVQCDERVATAPLAVVCRRFFSHDTGLCRPLYAHAVARVDAGAARSTTSPFRAECNAARCALQLDARPDRISGREAEQDVIRENISLAVSNGGGKSAIYISGLPGTGKTVTVQQAVRELLAASPKLFASVEINAFALAHPKDAYTELWSHIAVSGERLPREQALKKLKATLEWLPYMESIAKLQRMLERERGDDAECLAFFNSVSDALPDDVWVWPDGGFGAMSDGAACAKLRELVASVEAMQKRQPVVVMLDEVDSLVSQPNQGALVHVAAAFSPFLRARCARFARVATLPLALAPLPHVPAPPPQHPRATTRRSVQSLRLGQHEKLAIHPRRHRQHDGLAGARAHSESALSPRHGRGRARRLQAVLARANRRDRARTHRDVRRL